MATLVRDIDIADVYRDDLQNTTLPQQFAEADAAYQDVLIEICDTITHMNSHPVLSLSCKQILYEVMGLIGMRCTTNEFQRLARDLGDPVNGISRIQTLRRECSTSSRLINKIEILIQHLHRMYIATSSERASDLYYRASRVALKNGKRFLLLATKAAVFICIILISTNICQGNYIWYNNRIGSPEELGSGVGGRINDFLLGWSLRSNSTDIESLLEEMPGDMYGLLTSGSTPIETLEGQYLMSRDGASAIRNSYEFFQHHQTHLISPSSMASFKLIASLRQIRMAAYRYNSTLGLHPRTLKAVYNDNGIIRDIGSAFIRLCQVQTMYAMLGEREWNPEAHDKLTNIIEKFGSNVQRQTFSEFSTTRRISTRSNARMFDVSPWSWSTSYRSALYRLDVEEVKRLNAEYVNAINGVDIRHFQNLLIFEVLPADQVDDRNEIPESVFQRMENALWYANLGRAAADLYTLSGLTTAAAMTMGGVGLGSSLTTLMMLAARRLRLN